MLYNRICYITSVLYRDVNMNMHISLDKNL